MNKNFNLNYSDYSNTLVKNLVSWIDYRFYTDGGYFNTTTNFKSVDHPKYVAGRVWGTTRKNWDWNFTPIVKLNNVVNTDNIINYRDGLVIFNQPVSGTVNVEFRHKHIHVVDSKEIDYKVSYGKFDVYEGVYRENSIQLPAVIVDLGRSISEPLELGGYTRTVEKTVLLNIIHRSNDLVERISEILYNQVDLHLNLFDFDQAYTAGYYNLDFDGTLLNINANYPNLYTNYPYANAANKCCFIESSEDEGSLKIANNLYHNTIRYKIVADLKMGLP